MKSLEGTIKKYYIEISIIIVVVSLLWIKFIDVPEIVIIKAPEVKIEYVKSYEILENQTVYGYSSEVAQTDSTPFINARGNRVARGDIANNCYPFGTKVIVMGVGREHNRNLSVEDRMNMDLYGCDTWDIWFETRWEAIQWGKRTLNIRILK